MSSSDGEPGFAGVAGGVIRDFVDVAVVVRMVPSFGVALVLSAGAVAAVSFLELPATAAVLACLILTAPVLGYHALTVRYAAAPNGADVARFAVRFGLVATAWGVPAVALGHGLLPESLLPGDPLVPASWPSMVSLALGAGVVLVGAMLTALIAAAADGVGELFGASLWRWLRRSRDDLPGALASLLGGVLLFYVATLPLCLLVATLVVRVHTYAGVVVALVGYLSPAAAGILLAGRLAGAFAASRGVEAVTAAGSESIPLASPVVMPSAASGPAPRPVSSPLARPSSSRQGRPLSSRTDAAAASGLPGAEALAFIRAFQGLAELADRDLNAAIAEGEALHREQPSSAGVLAELAKLYRRAGRDDDAVATCSKAIARALHGGMSPVAVDLFLSFAAQRQRLELPTATFAALGRSLRAQGHADDAAWCLERAGEA